MTSWSVFVLYISITMLCEHYDDDMIFTYMTSMNFSLKQILTESRVESLIYPIELFALFAS